MSRNKMYDEILASIKEDFKAFDFTKYGLSDNNKIYKNISDLLDRMQAVMKLKTQIILKMIYLWVTSLNPKSLGLSLGRVFCLE